MGYKEIFTNHFTWPTGILIVGMWIMAAACALCAEFIVVKNKNTTAFKIWSGDISASLKEDIAVWILDVTGVWLFIGKIVTFGFTFYFAGFLNSWVSIHSPLQFLPHIPWVAARVVIYFLLVDLAGYWLHRIFHKAEPLWQLHKFHHSATEMRIFTARRDNPTVVPFFIVFTGLPLAIFGSPSSEPLWIAFFSMFHAMIIHSQIESNWGWVGKWVFVSPYGHSVHHSMSESHFDKNFAFMFPIWDHVFGSFYSGNERVAQVGIIDRKFEKSFVREIASNISSFVRLVFQKFRKTA
jgi:sterol desaturase/sphingolipid hydroxylase (fatty acid hydroxylase superfamily)